MQAGRTTALLIYGENLTTKEITVAKLPVKAKLIEVKATDPKLKLPGGKAAHAGSDDRRLTARRRSAELTLVQADGTKVTTPLAVVENVAQEVVVKKPAETFAQAMPVPGPSVAITGQLNGNVPDLFRLDAKAGETWEIFLTAGRMGSLMDPVLRLRDSRHIPLELSVGDKKKDRHLVFHVPADGAYYIELTEGRSKGGARLRLSSDSPQEMDASAKRKSPVSVDATTTVAPTIRGVLFDLDGTLGNTLPVCIGAFRRAVEPFAGREVSDAEIVATFGPSEEGTVHVLAPEPRRRGSRRLPASLCRSCMTFLPRTLRQALPKC